MKGTWTQTTNHLMMLGCNNPIPTDIQVVRRFGGFCFFFVAPGMSSHMKLVNATLMLMRITSELTESPSHRAATGQNARNIDITQRVPWYLMRMAFGGKKGLSTSLEGTWTLSLGKITLTRTLAPHRGSLKEGQLIFSSHTHAMRVLLL